MDVQSIKVGKVPQLAGQSSGASSYHINSFYTFEIIAIVSVSSGSVELIIVGSHFTIISTFFTQIASTILSSYIISSIPINRHTSIYGPSTVGLDSTFDSAVSNYTLLPGTNTAGWSVSII